MVSKIKYRCAAVLLCVLAIISFFTLTVSAAGETVSVTGVSGVTVGVNSNGTATESNGTVTVTTTGSFTSSKTATVTVTNTSGSTATISFDYSASNVYSCSLGTVSSYKCSGTKSELLTSGSSITFTIKTRTYSYNNYTATIELSNFKVEAVAASSNVTIQFDSGSVTVDGTGVENNQVVDISSSSGATIAATSDNFVGWIDTSNNKILSTSASFTLIPTEAMTIKAIHGPTARFFVEKYAKDGYLFETLPEAITYAATSTKVVVLANNGTLPALTDDLDTVDVNEGVYTIPSGVTLLIPNDAANTLYTTTPGKSNSAASAYRTLTMENGASITVNGAISVAGMQNGNHNDYADGAASGSLGYINMQSGSTITINQNANLYCWGYIIGDGAVNVYGTVYEDLQIADWRGGDALSQIYNNDLGIMPLTMFYVQNVQVPMTLHYGAVEIVVTRATATMLDKQFDCVFLGTGGVIGLLDSNATLIKDYDDANDRIVFTINGNCTIGGITITVPLGVLQRDVEIDSTKFYMPVNTTWDFIVKEGSNVTVSQDVALTPGSRFVIEKEATVSLAENARICVYDADNWGAYAFTGVPDCDNIHVPANLRDLTSTHDHSDEYARDAMIQVDGILDTSKGNFYTTTDGANICSTSTGQIIVGTNANTSVYQYEQINDTQDSGSDDYKKLGTVEIAVTPAQLKNADPTYVKTADGGAGTYNYINGFWHLGGHTFTEDPMVCDICGCFKFYANVVLGNNLDMMFAFPKSMLTDWTGCYAEIVRASANGEKDGTTTEEMANWGEVTIDGVECYTVTYSGFAAKEMCDTITLTVYDKDGKAISISWTDSIQAYALRMLDKTENGYLRTVIVDMLNYGAACQNALDYPAKNPSAESLATNGLADEQKAWATSNAPTVEDAYATVRGEDGTTWAGSQLETTSSIRYYLAFQNIEDGMYASYSYVGHKGHPVSGEKLDFVTVEGKQSIVIQDLVVADARYPITVTVFKADGTVFDSWQDSIEAYAARMTETDDVFAAFMKFADSAHAYLHSKGA